jgi:hypothetical protein
MLSRTRQTPPSISENEARDVKRSRNATCGPRDAGVAPGSRLFLQPRDRHAPGEDPCSAESGCLLNASGSRKSRDSRWGIRPERAPGAPPRVSVQGTMSSLRNAIFLNHPKKGIPRRTKMGEGFLGALMRCITEIPGLFMTQRKFRSIPFLRTPRSAGDLPILAKLEGIAKSIALPSWKKRSFALLAYRVTSSSASSPPMALAVVPNSWSHIYHSSPNNGILVSDPSITDS